MRKTVLNPCRVCDGQGSKAAPFGTLRKAQLESRSLLARLREQSANSSLLQPSASVFVRGTCYLPRQQLVRAACGAPQVPQVPSSFGSKRKETLRCQKSNPHCQDAFRSGQCQADSPTVRNFS